MLPPGFKVGSPAWLRLSKGELTIQPDTIGEIAFSLNIPPGAEHKGQKYYFIIEGMLQGYDVPVSAYGRVAVQTAK